MSRPIGQTRPIVGIYFTTADGSANIAGQACDANANGATAQPEACAITLTAGTYLLAVVSFGPFYTPADPIPSWVSVQLDTPAARIAKEPAVEAQKAPGQSARGLRSCEWIVQAAKRS